MTKWLTIFLVCSFISGQKVPPDEIVKVNVGGAIVKAGDNSAVNVTIEVKEGYHIQANKVDNELIIPTTLEINVDNTISLEKFAFPVSKKFKLEGTDEYLDVYDGKFEINIFFNAREGIQKGLYRMDGRLNYQACDSVRCLFPRSTEFSIEIEVQ